MECPVHKGSSLTVVCVSCDNALFCQVCMDDHDEDHHFKSIKTAAKKAKENLQEKLTYNVDEISFLSKKVQEIESEELDQDNTEKNESVRIKEQSQVIQSVVEDITASQVNYLSKQKQKNQPILKDAKDHLLALLNERSAYGLEIETILKLGSEAEVINKSMSLTVPKEMSTQKFTLKPVEFSVGKTDRRSLQRMIGRVTGSPEEDEEHSDCIGSLRIHPQASSILLAEYVGSSCQPQVLSLSSTFNFIASDYAEFIRSSSSACMWLKWRNVNEILLTDIRGDVKQVLKFTSEICGFRIASNHQLLVCGYKDKSIYQVELGGEPTLVFETQFHPVDVCPLKTGDIIASIRDLDEFTRTSNSRRMVVKYNLNGQVKARAEYDQFGDPLFVRPSRVTCSANTTNSTIGVINYTSKTSSQLVLFDSELKLKLRMTGEFEVVPGDTKFTLPTHEYCMINEALFLPSDNIVVTDFFNNSVVLLTSECMRLRTLLTDNIGPVSICLQRNGNLWCGFWKEGSGVIKIFK